MSSDFHIGSHGNVAYVSCRFYGWPLPTPCHSSDIFRNFTHFGKLAVIAYWQLLVLLTSTVNLRAYGRFLAIDTCTKLRFFYIGLVCNTPTYNFTSTAKAG